MKNLLVLCSVFFFSIAVLSSSCANQEALKPYQPSEIKTYKSVGVIKRIDADAGKITIQHEDIPGYMTAMEMTETVHDKKLIEAVKPGDKVDFEIKREGSKITITKLTKIGEVSLINAREIFKTNCAECHGENGEGTKRGIPLISGHALYHTEKEFIEQVTNGKAGKMPAFKDKLTGEEIAEVIKFVRQDIQKNSSQNKKHEHTH